MKLSEKIWDKVLRQASVGHLTGIVVDSAMVDEWIIEAKRLEQGQRLEQGKHLDLRLEGIELCEKSLHEPVLAPDTVDDGKLAFHINTNITYDVDRGRRLVLVSVRVNVLDNRGDKIGSLTVLYTFAIEDFDLAVKFLPGRFELVDGLTSTLNDIVTSTTRGIMFSEFRGTSLHHVVLPVMEAKEVQNT